MEQLVVWQLVYMYPPSGRRQASSYACLPAVVSSTLLSTMEQESGAVALVPTLVLGVAAAAVLLMLLHRWSSSSRRVRLPPGPRPVPVLGNLLLFAGFKSRHRELYKLAERYGPIMWLRLGTRSAVVVQSPELAMEILQLQDSSYASRPPPTYAIGLFSNNCTDMVFAPYGSHWRLLRKVMSVELLTQKRITDFQHVRLEELGRMVEAIGRHVGQPVDLGYLLGTLNLNNITRMGMSKAVSSRYVVEDPGQLQGNAPGELELVNLIRASINMSGLVGIGDAFPCLSFLDTWFLLPKAKMEQTKRQMDAFYSSVVREHRQYRAANPGCQPRDLVDVLLSIEALTDQMIMSHLNDMVAAGTDTAAVVTEWAMAELLRQPEALEQAAREVEQVVGRGRVVSDSDIPNLPFLQAVVKETLRMHPPAPLMIPHYSTQAATVGGYHIPANTSVIVNVWGVGQHPASWKHPDRFRPQRFLLHHPDNRAEVDVRGHHFQLLPFGAGKRMCPGIGLGLAMVHLTLATLLHSFTWSLPSDVKRPQDLDMSEHEGVVIQRALSLKAVPHPKR